MRALVDSTAPVGLTAAKLPVRSRLESVDLLRGVVMVLMALDHTRDYLHWSQVHGFGPTDFSTTSPPIFFTRWITHFCAPVFIFLAGTGAFLSGSRGKSKRALSWFLVTRGAWLILLELTVIHWAGWAFTLDIHTYLGIVIWAIGWSMIVLAALIHLPIWAIATFGILLIVGHNAWDGIQPRAFGGAAWIWQVLHAGGAIKFAPGFQLRIGYPLVPWIGVMAAGYAFGQILTRGWAERRGLVLRLGIALTIGFILLRFSNVYGDARPWIVQARPGFTVASFLDCTKYPPSLCYLLMTLGPALIVLAWADRDTPRTLKPLLVFGRVPMFYYLLHLPLIHGLALMIETFRFGSAPWLIGLPFVPHIPPPPADAGLPLWGVYIAWAVAIALLYPACAWFAALKRRRRDAWLSYL